jgi:hypothetical protein
MFRVIVGCLLLFLCGPSAAHHNAPDALQDFIEDMLVAVDSPHLLTSETDPSLLDLTLFPSMADVDYVLVAEDLEASQILATYNAILAALDAANSVCDSAMLVEQQDDGLYTLTIAIDYCDDNALVAALAEIEIPECQLEARPQRVAVGGKITLEWDSSYATWCRINELGEEYLDPEGAAQVPVTEVGLLYFTLECGADGVPPCEDFDTVTVFQPGESSGI